MVCMIQNIEVFDVVLLNTNEQATVLENFGDKNFLVEVYTNGKFVLKNINSFEIQKVLWHLESNSISQD